MRWPYHLIPSTNSLPVYTNSMLHSTLFARQNVLAKPAAKVDG